MTKDDYREFAGILTMLGDVFGKAINQNIIRVYWEALKGNTIDEFKAAADNIVRTHKYPTFPLPAQFIEYINPPEKLERAAYEALAAVEDRLTDNGWSSVCFPDPIIHYVIDNMGGWVRICDETYGMTGKDYEFWKKEFLNRYRAFAHRPPDGPVPRLIGVHEQNNRAKGLLDDDNMLLLPTGEKCPAEFIEKFIHERPEIEGKKERLILPKFDPSEHQKCQKTT
jgi:hypothetical protein